MMTAMIFMGGGGSISPLEIRMVDNAFFGNRADFFLTQGETSRLEIFQTLDFPLNLI